MIRQRLTELGLELPAPPPPRGAYVPAVRTGNLVFTAGQLPFKDGKLLAAGKVPTDIPLESAQAAARQAALNALAAATNVLESLDAVTRVVRVNVFINSAAGFADQPKVADGASSLLADIFGPAVGTHTRCAIGAAELPLNAVVEVDIILEVK
jgi:enamine deaminase RidA (YjgF/YER057c/UK114 family)